MFLIKEMRPHKFWLSFNRNMWQINVKKCYLNIRKKCMFFSFLPFNHCRWWIKILLVEEKANSKISHNRDEKYCCAIYSIYATYAIYTKIYVIVVINNKPLIAKNVCGYSEVKIWMDHLYLRLMKYFSKNATSRCGSTIKKPWRSISFFRNAATRWIRFGRNTQSDFFLTF